MLYEHKSIIDTDHASADAEQAGQSVGQAVPLQLMSKKKKKQEGVPEGEEKMQAVSEAPAKTLPGSSGQARADPASAGAPLFALGGREGLDAEGVEGEIRAYLEQRYHRFVGQALNDMEFGRGKRTTGYPGMWHASAGISGVGSCSVFYYSDEEAQRIRIVGIGHHVGRAAYRLDYATAALGGPGRILRIA